MLLWVKQRAVIDSVASKTVISMLIYELLKPNETITGERYRTQLMRLSRAVREKRPQYKQRHEKVIPQPDNARPHVAKPIKTYLETLK